MREGLAASHSPSPLAPSPSPRFARPTAESRQPIAFTLCQTLRLVPFLPVLCDTGGLPANLKRPDLWVVTAR
jgi:hypothetical protein